MTVPIARESGSMLGNPEMHSQLRGSAVVMTISFERLKDSTTRRRNIYVPLEKCG